MEGIKTTINETHSEKTVNSFPLIFQLNKSFLVHLKNFSKEDGDINKYLASISKNISPQDSSFSQDWTDQQRSVYIYFHIICVSYHRLLEKLELDNSSSEKSKLIHEEIEMLIDCGYNTFCERGTKNSINLTFSDINLKQAKTLFGSKSEQEQKPNRSELKIRITEDLSKLNSNEENFLNLNSKILGYGSCTDGRLDIYTKAHILKQILNSNYIKNEFIIESSKDDFIKKVEVLNSALNTMENDLLRIISFAESAKLTNEKYMNYVDIFINNKNKTPQALKELRKCLIAFQNINDQSSIKILERLFIQLLGCVDKDVCNDAVILLNMLYDETNWQERSQLPIKYKNTCDPNTIHVLIRKKDFSQYDKNIVCLTNSPTTSLFNKAYQIKWHEITEVTETSNPNIIKLIFRLGTFSKCGYYDWNVVKFKDGRFSTMKSVADVKLENEFEEAKGRYIVIDKSIRNLSIHEVFCDLVNAEIDKEKGKITKRGTFADFESKLQEYNQRYINCLYIMGALERDNHIIYDESTGDVVDIGDTEASPMAVTCRDSVSTLLGGDKQFKSLVSKANKFSMKIIVDSLTRISSSRYHRKYRNILLSTLDEKGKITICYGTDGHSISFEDSAVLNYRKVEAWDLLVNDMLNFTRKYKIDGMQLDNCQSWPHVMQIDHDEMFRIDSDGQPAYSPLEILNGEIVIRDEDCGFWGSELMDQYPNPLLIKLTKSIWKEFPNFVFIGECWSTQKFHNRHIVLAKSGVIPRMYTLPRALSSIFGRRIHRNGYMELCQPSPVSIFKELFNQNYQLLPEGSLVIQSSCGQVWPYPALLYGRGNWSAVDLLFALPDVPMTFMEEINGEGYRVQVTNVYESKDMPKTNKLPSNFKSKSYMNLEDTDEASEQSDSYNNFASASTTSKSPFNTLISHSKSSTHLKSQQRKTAPKVKSLVSLSGVSIKDIKNLKAKQESIVKEVGPEFGFDLTKIRYHYDHRRKMRSMHESLRHGSLVYLNVYDSNNDSHNHVLSFARHLPEETSIIAINFSSTSCSFKLDLKPLFPLFEFEINFNSVCYIEDWITEEKGDFYFLREVISEGHARTLNPYSSICFGFQLIPYTKDNYKRTMEKSFSRMITDVSSNEFKFIDNYQVAIQLKYILEKQLPIEEFANWFYSTGEKLTKYNITMFEFFNKIQFFKNNDELCSKFFKYCYTLKNLDINYKSLISHIDNVINSNKLGPIVFVTPELGRWSTVGGLGVMVDELTQSLANMGEDVIVITPYYERNRKGETGYLSKDPVSFKHIGNIEVVLDQKYVFGVHHGICNKVKLYFIHNFEVFPSPYAEGPNSYVLKQICLMSKSALELLCFLNTIPALIITNDWFTGLTAAYSKYGHFGETFKGTNFFHIVHNLEPTYEGRLYTSPNEGTLDSIHKLPTNCLVDPYWKSKVINPSRCALLTSDQWGTVSPSYKKDLMETSPLAPILNNHKRPFAFPNGIIKQQRLKVLKEKVGVDHLEAKKLIQKKYFNFDDVDYTIPLFSFVGRITQQKGVILILEAAEALIQRTNGKINFLLGGMGNMKDPYCISCVQKINYLKSKYPHNFWANPNEFFTDGPLVNIASDFGLMPSLFEPGGIVQHEFFIAGTPVVAFRTGGLKDTVVEYDWSSNKGNGILFENHSFNDFVGAVERAIALFKINSKYETCRINAFNSAIDLMDVATAWCKEFYRLREKTYYNIDKANNIESLNISCDQEQIYKSFTNFSVNDYVFLKGKFLDSNPDKDHYDNALHSSKTSVRSVIDGEARIPISFSFVSDINYKPSSVQVCGSFDKWQVRHPLTFDPLYNKWSITLKIKKGTHYYKYIVDGEWVVSKVEKTMKDSSGFVNNFITI